jgi:hypothetical protein
MKKEKSLKLMKVGVGMAILFMLGMSVSLSCAETDHHATHTAESNMSKVPLTPRMVLNLSPAAQEGLKLTMREHLEAIDAIVSALAQEDFAKAATLATEELGFSKHHVAMQREQGATFPPAYHDLAMAHHARAETLGEVMLTRDLKQILLHLEQTIHACVECHQAFRLAD